jgi:hypothetical protein
MKRPLTRKEKFWRGIILVIIALNLLFFYTVASAVFFFTTPHTFDEHPIVCFALPSEPVGTCDIQMIIDMTTNTAIGDVIPVDNPVIVNASALILSPAYNKTGETYYFGFQGEGVYGVNPTTGAVGCFDKIPTDTFQLNPAGAVPGYGERYHVAFLLCFPAEGPYLAVLVIHNGSVAILLTETQGSPELSVGPSGIIQGFNFNFAILFFTILILILEVVQSLRILLDVYPRAFPYRVEYPAGLDASASRFTRFKDWVSAMGQANPNAGSLSMRMARRKVIELLFPLVALISVFLALLGPILNLGSSPSLPITPAYVITIGNFAFYFGAFSISALVVYLIDAFVPNQGNLTRGVHWIGTFFMFAFLGVIVSLLFVLAVVGNTVSQSLTVPTSIGSESSLVIIITIFLSGFTGVYFFERSSLPLNEA